MIYWNSSHKDYVIINLNQKGLTYHFKSDFCHLFSWQLNFSSLDQKLLLQLFSCSPSDKENQIFFSPQNIKAVRFLKYDIPPVF